MQATIDSVLESFPFLTIELIKTPVWAWISLISLFVVAVILAGLFSSVINWLLASSIAKFSDASKDEAKQLVKSFTRPLRWLVAIILFSILRAFLPLSEQMRDGVALFETLIQTLAVLGVMFALLDRAINKLRKWLYRSGKHGAVAVLPLLSKTAKAVVIILGLLFLLQNFGFDVAAIIAGLGVGGVAIALAGQKTIENLFGGMTLVLDQPVRVGDFCKYDGDRLGVVEDIGLRSTRVRSLDRTLVTVPNADFSAMPLENFAARDMMRFYTVIGLLYSTKPDQVRTVLKNIKAMFDGDERIAEDARIRFVSFGASSLDLEIFAYVKTDDWVTFLEIREELMLSIMDIVHEAGSDFAFPSRTVYLEGGDDLLKQLSGANSNDKAESAA